MSKIEVDSLVKDYGSVVAVDGVNFEVEEGELVSILGPSGCGKSTTLRCIAGLEEISGGSITLDGRTVSVSSENVHIPPAKRNLGMVFQSYALWPNKTVLENVKFGLDYSPNVDMEDDEKIERSKEFLELVDLQGYEDSSPRELSGGEQQRVALARALVYEPEVLLLDEPLSNLDAKLRQEARLWLKDLQEETGVTTVYVTHDQAEASALSDRMIILDDGQVEQTGSPEDVFTRPKNEFVADFLGKENFIEGQIQLNGSDEAVVSTDANDFVVDVEREGIVDGDTVKIAISPEEVELTSAQNGAKNVVTGTITQKLYYGDKTELVVDVAGQEIIVIAIETVTKDKDDEVSLRLPPEKCALLN